MNKPMEETAKALVAEWEKENPFTTLSTAGRKSLVFKITKIIAVATLLGRFNETKERLGVVVGKEQQRLEGLHKLITDTSEMKEGTIIQFPKEWEN